MSIYDEIVLYCDSRIDRLSICSCIKDDSAVHDDLLRIRNEIRILSEIKKLVKGVKDDNRFNNN